MSDTVIMATPLTRSRHSPRRYLRPRYAGSRSRLSRKKMAMTEAKYALVAVY